MRRGIAAGRARGDSSGVLAKSAVIGAGAMGHGIGEVLARAYPEVWLYDPDAATLERAVALIRESVERLERHGLITAAVARDTPARVRHHHQLGARRR